MLRPDYPMLCSIAGYDPTGRAGASADRRTWRHAGIPGTSVLTAWTAQDDEGVHAVVPLGPEHVRAQLAAIDDRYRIGAFKTGMLPDAATAQVVVEHLADVKVPVVVDPVMGGSAGGCLTPDDAIDVLRRAPLGPTTILTPNAAEAARLLDDGSSAAATITEAERQAHALLERGGVAVVITGVRLAAREVVDVLVDADGDLHTYARPLIPDVDPRGTGCVFASCVAIACAGGASVSWAVQRAGDVLHAAIARAATSDDARCLRLEGCPLPTAPRRR